MRTSTKRLSIVRPLAALAVIGFSMLAHPAAGQASISVFNAAEVRSSDLSPFPKWTTMIARYAGEHQRLRQPCQQSASEQCMLRQWVGFLDSLHGLDPRTQIEEVNRRMNSAPYIEDIMNYGIPDYWASPNEFFENSGDCEDYAIAKFMSLRLLGFSNDDMRVAVVQDTNLNLIHAVLIVEYNGQSLVLDNQIAQVVPTSAIHHYVPYFTINEQYWWQHTL